MNLEIYCKSFRAVPDHSEIELRLEGVDRASILDELLEKFTLHEIITQYDYEFVCSTVRGIYGRRDIEDIN